jgi:hypothetical protein
MSVTVNGESTRTDQDAPHGPGPSDATALERAFVGVLKTERAELRSAGAGLVFAGKDVVIERGGARDIVAGGAVRLTQAGAGVILAAGDTSIHQGGAGSVVSLGRMQIEQGGACCLAAGSATVGRGGVVLLAITPRLDVAEGGRVFGGPVTAIAAVIGLALGFAASRLIGRRRR